MTEQVDLDELKKFLHGKSKFAEKFLALQEQVDR